MSIFRKISEDKIRKAMDAGLFDNLSGKGKPLQLEDNPFEPAEVRSANHILKENGFTLPWIDSWNEIEHQREANRRKLRLAHQQFWQVGRMSAWQLALADFTGQVAALNRQILGYNLTVPSAVFQKPLLDPEREIKDALNG